MMCYCASLVCSCGGYPRTAYMNPALGAPYAIPHPIDPFEDAYRIALRSLEDSFEREITILNQYYSMNYDQRSYYYEKESEIRYRYEKARNRLYDDIRASAHRYVSQSYGYGLRQNRWAFPSTDYSTQMIPYQSYSYTYLNSKTGETTPVMPTETKTYIVVSSVGANETPKIHNTYDEAEKEAKRLARKFPAQEFTVFTSTKKYKIAEKPVDIVVCV